MYSNRHILKISAPIFLSLLAQNLIQVIDTAFLGRVGEVELGASAIAGVIYIVIYIIGFGFSMGSQILIGRRNGEKNYDRIGEIVIQGTIFLLMAAVALIPILVYGAANWVPHLFDSSEVAAAVTDYLEWRVFGLLFSFMNLMFRAFYIGIARTKVLTVNAIVMGVVNVIFDYGLIFGNLGMPELGMAGAAIASVIAELSSTLFLLIYTRKTVDLAKYGFNKFSFRWSVIKKTLDISIFMMVQYLFSTSTWMLFFLLIENKMGERPLAVTNIVRSFYTIFTIPSHAIGSSTGTLVSNTIGAGKTSEVSNLVKRLALISLVVMLIVISILLAFPEMMIKIYTNNPSLIEDTVVPLYVMISSLPIYSVGTVFFSAVSGTGNTRTALVFEIATLVLYIAYMWLIIVHLQVSVALVWTTEHVYWSLLMTLSFLYLRSGKWKEKKI